jgi:hypothetical protein
MYVAKSARAPARTNRDTLTRVRLESLSAVAGALGLLLIPAGCSSSSASTSAPLPVVACSSATAPPGTDAFALADVGVYVDSTDPLLDPVRADLASYLGTMWGGTVTVASGAPDGSRRASIWLSSSTTAAATLGTAISDGYVIRRIDSGDKTTLLVYAPSPTDLASGTYALLEELGARFFHPKQELVPQLGGPRLPHTIDVWRHPLTQTRGLQPHTLHPIEYFDVFMQPSDDNLADAKRFVDWLVKTGQNYMQWPLLSTVEWSTWKPYAESILTYAHSRGVQIGAQPEVWGGAALQNNYVLVTDADNWATEMRAGLEQLMQLPWDRVELALGEFESTDPQAVIDWLDYATEYLNSAYPAVLVDVQNHVGNYPQLWVPYDGQTLFYYHLFGFCDLSLGQSVHTLSIFDLYRDWATYAHPNFYLQHDYLLGELASGHRAGYFPEAAYWISADIDVPLFLPETLYSRWLDIHTLSQQLLQQGLPPLDHHIEFMSGHEWNYWLTDYLVAKMLWQPDAPLDTFLQSYTSAFGNCAADVDSALSQYISLQTTYIFDQRLFAYVQGENETVDLGYLAGLETHPKRIEFEQLMTMTPAELSSFEGTVVQGLESFAAQSQPIEDAIAARCRGSDPTLAPWCEELQDGITIVTLRAQHAATLYRAMLDYVRKDPGDATSLVTQAGQITTQAAAVVAHRESQYRFDLTRETGQYQNPTIYPFGYLRQAHTLCYWHRREQQVTFILQNGVAEGQSSLPSCGD